MATKRRSVPAQVGTRPEQSPAVGGSARAAPTGSTGSAESCPTRHAGGHPNATISTDAALVDVRQQLKELIDSFRSESPQAFRELQANGILQAAFNLAMTCNSDIVYLKAVFVRMVGLRSSLGIKEATPLERLLIDQITACAVRVEILELLDSNQSLAAMFSPHGRCLDRRLHNARRLYLRAIESLARVRRLLKLPSIRIGVAAVSIVPNGASLAPKRELVEVPAATGDRQLE